MKNIVICASLQDESLDLIRSIKGSALLADASLHFVHCFEIHVYTSDFSPYVYPSEDKYHEIEEATKRILGNLAEDVCTDSELKNTQLECYFAYSPKQKIIEYLTEVNADMLIVASKQKHGIVGLFSSSLTEHLVKYAPCDIHILRPKD